MLQAILVATFPSLLSHAQTCPLLHLVRQNMYTGFEKSMSLTRNWIEERGISFARGIRIISHSCFSLTSMSSIAYHEIIRDSSNSVVISWYILSMSKFVKRHTYDHTYKKYDCFRSHIDDASDRRTRTESSESPSDSKKYRSCDELHIDSSFFFPGKVPFFSKKWFSMLVEKIVSDKRNTQSADHDKQQGRIPCSENIEKSLYSIRG